MGLDVNRLYEAASDTAERATAPRMAGLRGSSILAIAAEVRRLRAEGKQIHNLTIGDFDPSIFPIPEALRDRIKAQLDAGQTNYPPAVGTLELREAIRTLYRRELDLDFPLESIIVASGARPPIYSAFGAIVAEGDTVVYPAPSWNVNHYCYLNRARGIPVVAHPENGFMPTAEQLAPHLPHARMLVLNSPQNPSGTMISEALLTDICKAIVAENERRRPLGERPLFLLYDSVYWRMTFGGAKHVTPLHLVPEMAPYTVIVDAVSKWWAGTGLRVGWAISPPWVRAKQQALVGHMGAWAARAEQMAVAELLEDPASTDAFMAEFLGKCEERLKTLQNGIQAMAAEGLPITCLPAEGAIYLSVQLDLIGKPKPDGGTFETDEDIRSFLLHQAGIAVVPFTAFGYPEGSGWLRMSIGSVTMGAVNGTLSGLREVLAAFA
jgi:aspartate aminotransferase